jgi:hypothetical protein
MQMELTAKNVDFVVRDCIGVGKPVAGIVHSYTFSPEAIKTNHENIRSMLAQLPLQFRDNAGGGWSFLQACDRRDGVQWTGVHMLMEQLFCLGIAADLAKELTSLPREALPGGVPYYVLTLGDVT